MFDPISLSATAVGAFLLPYVKKGAEKMGEVLAKEFGEGAGKQVAETAGKRWDKVTHVFSSEKEITTLNLFKEDPETYQEPVKKILSEKLKSDPALAEEVHQLLKSATSAVPGGGASIQNAVNA